MKTLSPRPAESRADLVAGLRTAHDKFLVSAVLDAVAPVLKSLSERISELESKPSPKWCGPFRQGESYPELSFVVCNGGLWVAERSTNAQPGSDDSGWELCVKSGRHDSDR
jgi:hypothetical protein